MRTIEEKATQRQTEKSRDKTDRVPFGAHRLKLQLSPKDEEHFRKQGYIVHWFNDLDGRIERALSGGYEFVQPSEATSLGQNAVHAGNTDEGAKVSKIVSRGEPVVRAYLMKIKKEWYDEDQKAKELVNQKVDEALAGGEIGEGVENKYGPGVTYGH